MKQFSVLILLLLGLVSTATSQDHNTDEGHTQMWTMPEYDTVEIKEGIRIFKAGPDVLKLEGLSHLSVSSGGGSVTLPNKYVLIDVASHEDMSGFDSTRIRLHRDSVVLPFSAPFVIEGLQAGSYEFHVTNFKDGEPVFFKTNGKGVIKISLHEETAPPLFENDAIVLGLLFLLLVIVFYTSGHPRYQKFYKYVPALLLCYFLPALLNTFDIVDPHQSQLYHVASRYLLPASLVLLCMSIDLKAIMGLGRKALIMFFAATIGIVLGGPLAMWLVSMFDPSILMGDDPDATWRGLATVAGSWIGGGANQTAMKEIAETPSSLFSAMVIVDVFVANLLMSFLLFGTGYREKLNKFFKADNTSIRQLETKMSDYQASIAKIPTTRDIMLLLGIAFTIVGLSHMLADIMAPWIGGPVEAKLFEDPDHWYKYLVSFKSAFFWMIVFATLFGITLSFTRMKRYEGVGASKFGSIFLYVLVATIGMEMDIYELIQNWGVFKVLISIGLIWMLFHVLIIFLVGKLIKAPFFFIAVGSQANVGGAASAPVVASAFNPALAPVGVLLAVLGYAIGTVGAILCATMMQYVSHM